VNDITVIIPVYNGAGYVRKAVDCVLAQQPAPRETIVIDDGSTDNTLETLAAYGDRIRLITQPNGGPARARNHAMRVATTEWVAFLDSDDEWMPEKLAKQWAMIDGADLVYTDRTNFGPLGEIVGETQSDGVKLWEGDVFEHLLMDNFITTSSVLARRSLIQQVGGFDEQLGVCEDWDLWLKLAAAGGRVRLCRESLTRYCWREGSLSTNQVRNCRARLTIVHRALQTERGRALSRKIQNQAVANAWSCSAWHAAPSQPAKAIDWYLRSAWYWPWDPAPYKGVVKSILSAAGLRSLDSAAS
jgi:glycosyltransferase involved in cell wall biosynthesis